MKQRIVSFNEFLNENAKRISFEYFYAPLKKFLIKHLNAESSYGYEDPENSYSNPTSETRKNYTEITKLLDKATATDVLEFSPRGDIKTTVECTSYNIDDITLVYVKWSNKVDSDLKYNIVYTNKKI